MRRGAAPDLALVLAAEEAGRRKGAAVAERSRKLRRFYRRLAAGKVKRPPPRLSREERAELWKVAKAKRAALIIERERQADTAIPMAWRDAEEYQEFLDEGFDWAEAKAAREVRHAITRERVADRYVELAAYVEAQGRADAATRHRATAEKLRGARKLGWWGFDRMTGKRYLRFRDRSGLVRLDPSECNRDSARQIRRVVPRLLQLKAQGFVIYKAVFSMPNVPLGRLAWGKAEIFRMMARALEAFPEIVGRFDAQEDPLAKDGQHWNVHVNSIMVVDPKRCTRLPLELARQCELNLPGQLGKLPARLSRDRTPPGCLSYAKLHHVWGGNQVELKKLEARDAETLAEALAEVVKYAVKWVGKKHFDQESARALAPAGAGDAAQPAGPSNPGLRQSQHAGAPGDRALDRSEGPAARDPDPLVQSPADTLAGIAGAHDRARAAPPLVDWPLAELDEWDSANVGKRRVRTFGVLFSLPPDDPFEDPELDGLLRWCGHVRVSARGFQVEAARLLHLDLIHGDKSGAIFPAPPCRSPGAQARAGPATGAVPA